jgi:hypothetical protein
MDWRTNISLSNSWQEKVMPPKRPFSSLAHPVSYLMGTRWSLISQSGKGMHRKTTHVNHICALYSLLNTIPIPVNAIMPPFWKCEYLLAAVWKWQWMDSQTVSLVAYCWPHIRFFKIHTDGSQGCQFQTVGWMGKKLPAVLLNPIHAEISSVRSGTVVLQDNLSIPLTFVT